MTFGMGKRGYGFAVYLSRAGFDVLGMGAKLLAQPSGQIREGIQVPERLSIEPGPGPVNLAYLQAKRGKLGHLFEAM